MTSDAGPSVDPDPALGAADAELRNHNGRSGRTRLTRRQQRALGVLAFGGFVLIAWLSSPVIIGILLGALIAFTLQPLYDSLARRTQRAWVAALLCVGAAGVGIAGVAAAIGYLLVSRGAGIAASVLASLGPDGAARAFIVKTSSRLPNQLHPGQLLGRLENAAAEIAQRAGFIAGAFVNATFGILLEALFMLLTTYFILRNWPSMVRGAEQILPLHPRDTRALFDEFRLVGRTTLLGTVVTGAAQGALATIGYWIIGVPEAAFLGALTAVASLLPAVGTLLIWVPVGVVLMLAGHSDKGALLLGYGSLVIVGFSDYVLRPRLVTGGADMPALLTLVSLFGGLELFGIAGLIVGPVLMALALALLRLYTKEKRRRPA
jgi:predicted PurR-regulated permease PerM